MLGREMDCVDCVVWCGLCGMVVSCDIVIYCVVWCGLCGMVVSCGIVIYCVVWLWTV